MDTFLSAPTSLSICNMQVVQDDEKIQSVPIAIYLMISGAHLNIWYIIKVKIFVLMKWSYKSPLEPRTITIILRT